MDSIDDLPSGEVEFVDSELEDVWETVEDSERVSMLLRPVAERTEFIDTLEELDFGEDCDYVGIESVVVELSEEECDELLEEEVVEAVELNRPLTWDL